ncbi:MAG: tetratricopeptide repeat protein [Alphaproteobacteria bacterium]
MGILSFLFGRNSRKSPHRIGQNSAHSVTFDENLLHIGSLNYFGFYETSETGEWVVSWLDSDRENHVGGFREQGHGRFILYNKIEDTIILDSKFERPNHGHVANTGFCTVEDWMFGNGLMGTFYALSPVGEVVIERYFEANIYNSAISPKGILAVCQTCNAKCDDGNKLTAFEISSGRQLFSVTPSTGWADRYEFDEDSYQIIVVHDRIGKFRYDIKGTFLDTQKFDADKLMSDDSVSILLTVEQNLKTETSQEELEYLLKSTLRAKSLQVKEPNGWDSVALKLEGITLEKLGRIDKAIVAYQEALSLNPKIGVAKRLSTLQKKLKAE